MAEYIDREAAIAACFDGFADCRDDCAANIRNIPAADVVEVVRCKDCVHGEVDDTDFPNQYLCHFYGDDWNDALHYCSYGERKLNNDRTGEGASGAPEGDPDAEV